MDADASLITRIRSGDEEAFNLLFRRHVGKVYRQAVRLMGSQEEAEEVVQDVFLAIYEKAQTFRGEAAFSTWLYRLTLNVALTRLRRKKRSREVHIEDYLPRFQDDGHHEVRPVVDWSQDVEAAVTNDDLRRVLQEALQQLSPLDKAVVVQSDLEGVSNAQIANALGLTVPAVKARLHRSRLFLRGTLATHLGHSPF
jgi:RNA polymerase sigma-70 factor (ECF subfamily)